MRIEENKVFLFNFESAEMGGGCSFPIRANSREEAVQILQRCLGRFNAELAMEFPKVMESTHVSLDPSVMAPGQVMPIPEGSVTAEVPTGLDGILLERIDSLMKDLGGSDLKDTAKAQTIKNWTELDFISPNYAAIVHELELLASGAKKIPVQAKKK